ncbi:MAG: hypothetical protein ACRDSN_18620 [Pseudonocardiaceae bacterium]
MRLPRPTDPDADWCDWVVVHRVMTRRPVGRALEWAELVAVRDRLAARGRLGDLGAVTGLTGLQLGRFEVLDQQLVRRAS